MQVNANFDEQGYIANYAVIGTVENAIDVDVPEDFWQHNSQAYKLVDGALQLDAEREAELATQEEEEETVTDAERIAELERSNAELREALEALLRGDTDA